jgi:RND family efflux transporter MFP subunit
MNEMKRNHVCGPLGRPASVLAVLLGVLGVVSCGRREESGRLDRSRLVKVMTLENGGMDKVVEFPGQIMAVRQSWKAFEVGGRITEMPVKEGQEVRKGQLLARLDQRDYKSARDHAQAQFRVAESVEGRLRTLEGKGGVSQQALDLAERDLRIAAANLEQAEKALEDTSLLADFDGKVANLLVEDFANVTAKQNVMVIQDASSLEIVIDLPESVMALRIPGDTDAEKVANCRPVVIPSALPQLEIPVRFSEVSDTPDPVTRTYEVTLSFTPPQDSRIRPGMTAKVRAVVPANAQNKSQGYPVPMHAVFSDDGGCPHLWKVDPETLVVSRVDVETGAMADEIVVVTGEVRSGDLIAVSGVHQLRDGQAVRAWELPGMHLAK